MILNVRTVVEHDLPEVSRIHKRTFSNHYLNMFSEHLIERFYAEYKDCGCFLVCEADGKVVGFVLGGESRDLSQCATNFISNNRLNYCVEIALRPSTWATSFGKLYFLIQNTLRKICNPKHEETKNYQKSYGLLSIAVDEEFKGKGVSQLLVEAFGRKIPAPDYGLSVKGENERALNFYKKLGFIEVGRFGHSVYLRKTNL